MFEKGNTFISSKMHCFFHHTLSSKKAITTNTLFSTFKLNCSQGPASELLSSFYGEINIIYTRAFLKHPIG